MSRLTPILVTLYVAAGWGLPCVALSGGNSSWPQALAVATMTALLTMAAAREYLTADERRALLREIEALSRPLVAAQDRTVAEELAAACCELWWTSCGAAHDPHHCTRKDTAT